MTVDGRRLYSTRAAVIAVTKLHVSRSRKDFTPPYPLRVLSCLHLPGLRCLCCNVVRFCCDLEACNLVMATIQLVFDAEEGERDK
jgi:hypothetical protein